MDCAGSKGGIQKAWIACYDNVSKPTITAGVITALGTPTSEWKEYEFKLQTGSADTTITRDDTSGTSYFQTAIILQFHRQETAKRIEINALAFDDVAVIILDSNGEYRYFGISEPVMLTEGTISTGTSRDDLNGYNITLTSVEDFAPYHVTEGAMAPLLGVTP